LLLASAAAMVLQHADVVLLGILDGPAAAGEYAPVLRVFHVSMVVVSAVGFYFFSVGASLVRAGDVARLRSAFVSVTKWAMVLTVPLLLTLLIVPAPIMTALYGSRFPDTELVARVLAIGYLVNVVFGVNGAALIALGATRQIAIRSVVLMISNIVLNLILIPIFGTLGAAIATTGVTLALNLANAMLIWRIAKLSPIRRDTVSFSGAVLIAGIGASAIVWGLGLQDTIVAPIGILLSMSFMGIVVALVTLRPEERNLLKGFIGHLRSK